MSLRFVLLTLISEKPQSGYDVLKTMQSSVGYFWQASHQQIYRELAVLQDKGLVNVTLENQSGKPDRKLYDITVAGREELMQWLHSSQQSKPTREALLVKLLGISICGVVPLRSQLKSLREGAQTTLETYLQIETMNYQPPPKPSSPVFQQMLYLALRNGILITKARIEWLDETLESLNQLAQFQERQ